MQDRFKFKLWDIKAKQFISPLTYSIDATGMIKITRDFCLTKWFDYEQDYILLQCTSLRDKNGRLIYEGDIVKFYSCSFLDAISDRHMKLRIGQVIWNDECLKFDVVVNGNAVPDLCKKTDDNQFEVIGNIYENPELLKE